MKKTLLFSSLTRAFACLLLLALALACSPVPRGLDLLPPAEAAQGQHYREHRSKRREDYPHLSDEDFANFRCVATTGMGRNVLYRSSSPVNPSLSRNDYADAAARDAGIRTVLNLADNRKEMTDYAPYANSYYSGLDVIALHMSQNRTSKRNRNKLAKGLRFIIAHEGPYLVHCTMGRDRTGFACAILECLMGASAEEVIDDYMLTYYNFYGIEPGMEKYDENLNEFCADLAKAFKIDRFPDQDVDLAQCANDYILRLGLTGEEVAALKDRLGKDLP